MPRRENCPKWDLTPEEAVRWQESLRQHLVLEDDLPPSVRLVGGVDSGYTDALAVAVIAVLTYPELEFVHQAVGQVPVHFPYIPGLLAIREGPAIEAAWNTLQPDLQPDLLFFDGQGIAHPRGMGIASHMGVLLDRPSIGVAKRILVGHHEPVPDEQGAWRPLVYRGKVVGAAVRTKVGVKPVYVSPGHRISLPTAIEYTLATVRGYKLPEPTRLADKLARQWRRKLASGVRK